MILFDKWLALEPSVVVAIESDEEGSVMRTSDGNRYYCALSVPEAYAKLTNTPVQAFPEVKQPVATTGLPFKTCGIGGEF